MAASMSAILTAVEECALGVIGTTETVPAGTFARGIYQPLDKVGDAANAFVKSRVEVELVRQHETGLLPRMSNMASLKLELLIRCSFTTSFELIDDARRAARAAAMEKTELVRAALSRAQNITQTSGAVATQLVGGCLIETETRFKSEDHKDRLIVTEITAKALVQTSRP